jgi:hypothetical protein
MGAEDPWGTPIVFGGALAENEWPVTVAASAEGYVGKRVEVSLQQEQQREVLVIDLARQ